MTADVETILDCAQAAKEVALLTALVLLQTKGDGEAALSLLSSIEHLAQPESLGELDATAISQQAIREAIGMRSGTEGDEP